MDFIRRNPSALLWATQILLLLLVLFNISQALNAHGKYLKHIMLLNSIDTLTLQVQQMEQQPSDDLSFQRSGLKRFNTQFIDKLSQLENGSTEHSLPGLSSEYQPLLAELLSKATPIFQWVSEREADYQRLQQRQNKNREHYAAGQEIQATLHKLTASDLLDQLSTYQVMLIYRIQAHFLEHMNTLPKLNLEPSNTAIRQLDNDLQQLVHGEKQVKNLVFRRTLANLNDRISKYAEALLLANSDAAMSENKNQKHTPLDSVMHSYLISSQKLALALNNQNGQGNGVSIYLILILLVVTPAIYRRWIEPKLSEQDATLSSREQLFEPENSLRRQDLSELKRARNQLINEIRSLNQGLLYIEASTQHEKTQDIANAYNEGIRCIVAKIDLFKKTFHELSDSLEPLLSADRVTADRQGGNSQLNVDISTLQPEMLESMKTLESIKSYFQDFPDSSNPAIDNKLNESIINHFNLLFKLKTIEEGSSELHMTTENDPKDHQRIANIKQQLVLMENVLNTLKVSNSSQILGESSDTSQEGLQLVTA